MRRARQVSLYNVSYNNSIKLENYAKGSQMKHREEIFSRLANITIWLLMSFGMLFHFLFIPMLSRELPATYVEFNGDGLIIQVFLSTITLAAQATLLAVSLLLRRILKGSLFSQSAITWVNVLATSCATFSAFLVALLYWLSFQGAAAPAIAFGLIGGTIVAAAFTFVTLSLKYILKAAIANEQELEAVI